MEPRPTFNDDFLFPKQLQNFQGDNVCIYRTSNVKYSSEKKINRYNLIKFCFINKKVSYMLNIDKPKMS